MIQQNNDRGFKYVSKEFEFTNKICEFLNENPQYELVSFCLGRQNKFVAIYKDLSIKP